LKPQFEEDLGQALLITGDLPGRPVGEISQMPRKPLKSMSPHVPPAERNRL
jgi:hypothetical protein